MERWTGWTPQLAFRINVQFEASRVPSMADSQPQGILLGPKRLR